MKSTQLIAFCVLISLSEFIYARPRPAMQWIARPWEVRYLIFIGDLAARNRETAASIRFNNGKNADPYFDGEALFRSYSRYSVPDAEHITTVLITFDQRGKVKSEDLSPGPWVGKRTALNSLVLINEEHPQSRPYHMAEFDQGIAGEMTFSPAICSGWDDMRYTKDWRPISMRGEVGCREWTARLYNSDRPYIDVTTYSKYGHYIGQLVGWSRFTDPPKPVIGKQGKTWLCLHECPAGETPGIIPNIRKWTQKHGFPMPRRPKKQPEYPNSDFKDSWME